MITLGNHTWRRQRDRAYLNGSDRVVRPANLAAASPGAGWPSAGRATGRRWPSSTCSARCSSTRRASMWEVVDDLVDEAAR